MRCFSNFLVIGGLALLLLALTSSEKSKAVPGLTGTCTGTGNCTEVVIYPNGSQCNCSGTGIPTCLGIVGNCNWKAVLYTCPGTNSVTGLACNGVSNWGGCK